MNKTILTFCYIALLFFSSVFGATRTASVGEPQQCIRLGLQPAFIIKFKNKISSFKLNNALDANFLRVFSTSEVKFTGLRILSRGVQRCESCAAFRG